VAEITTARKGQLLRKLFELLMTNQDGLPASEAIRQLQTQIPLTEYELGRVPTGAVRFDVNVRFATTDLNRAGWLAKHKGVWTITEEGKAAYQKYTDPEQFYRQANKLYTAWRKAQSALTGVEADAGNSADEDGRSSAITFEQAEEQAWAEIEQYLRNLPPYEFQDLVASLLRAMGYHVSWIAPPGKDGGLDILAWGDPLGTRPPRIKVQVKRYSQNITVDGLRSFMALLGDDDVGLFVTTSGFTKDARDEARTQTNRKVTLVDLERFFDLWVDHYPKLDDAARRRFPLQPIYFLAPGS
jgi:restriction system protein